MTQITTLFPVKNVVREKHNQVKFRLDFKNLDKLFALIEEKCYNVTVLETHGLCFTRKKWLSRLGLWVGGLCAVFACVLFSQFVWKVDVSASEGIDAAAIRQLLQEDGIAVGAWKRGVRPDDVEKQVYLHFSQAAFVSCKMHGVNLKVKVVSALTPTEIPAGQEGDMLSGSEGVVSRVVVTSGTPLVKPGDRVQVGTPLIGGYLTGETETKPVPALGDVFILQTYEYTDVVALQKTVKTRTGNYVETSYMDFLGWDLPMRKAEIPYAEYETEESFYYPFQNNFLPIKVYVTKYYELAGVTEDIKFENVENISIEHAVVKAREKIEGNYTVVNTITEHRREGNNEVIEVLLQIERRA